MHAMIDLETLSTQSDAAVISVGVAVFDDEKIIESAGWALEPTSVHGHIHPPTLFWWSEQGEAARTFSFTGKFTDATLAFELKTLLARFDIDEVWSKDPHFDHVILENWWRRVAAKTPIGAFPIHYRTPRAYRTLEAEAIRSGFEKKDWEEYNYVAHNPIEDAVTQARAVIRMRSLMGSRHGT